jgi:adenine phosphoribosyltransferase
MNLKKYIRDVPDFPKPGILFKDITTLLKEPKPFRYVINKMADHYKNSGVQAVVAIESRGFILGSPIAYKLKVPFIPVRKSGKLPAEVATVEYSLEYGTDKLAIHKDAITPGLKVLLVDDLLATGGTTEAVIKLLTQLGAEVIGIAFMVELSFLKGREKLKDQNIFRLIEY